MRVLTIDELWRLSRIELTTLDRRIASDLPKFSEGSPERTNALTSLRNIRFTLARPDLSP